MFLDFRGTLFEKTLAPEKRSKLISSFKTLRVIMLVAFPLFLLIYSASLLLSIFVKFDMTIVVTMFLLECILFVQINANLDMLKIIDRYENKLSSMK